jgi:hypothetical protein
VNELNYYSFYKTIENIEKLMAYIFIQHLLHRTDKFNRLSPLWATEVRNYPKIRSIREREAPKQCKKSNVFRMDTST